MRKDVSGLLDTLYDSVAGIVASAAPDANELLTKSFGEFNEALDQQLEVEYGPDPEPLGKGLNHIAAFANALGKMEASVEAIKAGRPIFQDQQEPVLASTVAALDRFLGHGDVLLRQMTNDTARIPDDEEDLERAEKAGELVKIESRYGDEMLVKSDLPDDLVAFLTDPLDLMTEIADLGSAMIGDARDIADALLKGDAEAIPEEVAEAFPLVFEPLQKAPPPPQRKPAFEAQRNQGDGGQGEAADEPQGDESTDTGDDPGDAGDGGASTDITDDTPQNPIETITRLASIIVVIAGSLQQSMQGQDFTGATSQPDMAGGQGSDMRNVGLQRGEPILDQPLQKILAGEAELQVPGMGAMTFAEALEELSELRKRVPQLNKELGEKGDAFSMLKQRYDQIASQVVKPPGMQKVVSVGKGEDSMPGSVTIEGDMEKLEKLQSSDPEGGAAAKFLIGRVHQGGGVPLVP
jgi:Mg2+ and Co2+ transporter CorA